MVIIIVFRPDPVQGPGSGFWPGRPDQFFYLKKSKWRRFSKKKKSTGCNQVFDRVLPSQPAKSHQVFLSPVFSSTRPGFNPWSARSRVDLPDFKIMIIILKWAVAMKASTMWINIPVQVDVFGMLEQGGHYYTMVFTRQGDIHGCCVFVFENVIAVMF
jgi:hypothetical protein